MNGNINSEALEHMGRVTRHSAKKLRKTMLVLTRKLGESIAIDDHIKIVVVQIKGKQVRLGIKAPKETKIHREEVYQAIRDQNTEAALSGTEQLSQLEQELKKK